MGMGEWIRADLSRIGQVAGQVSALGAEFERATALVDGYEDALGSAVAAYHGTDDQLAAALARRQGGG